jgi:vitamin B12/bleomycin/antimicrobial peptide transport system ATP-binding/permease protein
MSLGQVMQAASAFTIVQGAFNWLVDNYPRLSDWTASARRASLEVSLDALEEAETGGVGRIKRGKGEGAALRLRNLSVTLDDGTAVVNEANREPARAHSCAPLRGYGSGAKVILRSKEGQL